MCFTYNIAVGITAGFLLYPFCKLVQGKAREVKAGLWVLAGLSLLFFVFYPYRVGNADGSNEHQISRKGRDSMRGFVLGIVSAF